MRVFFSFLVLLLCSISYGRTFYLSPQGADSNPGTLDQPFFTLNKAWTVLAPGDTIYLRGGIYQYESTQYLKDKEGNSTNLIKIWSYPDEQPIITRDPSSYFAYTWASGILFSGNYFHWKGIEITGFKQQDHSVYTGLRVSDANNNIFEQINSHHNGHGCVITGKSGNNLVLNSDFHHNQDPLTTLEYSNADGLEICYIPAGFTNTVKGCRFWWNSDDGIDLWQNDGVVVIDNCWSWNNGFIPDTYEIAGNGSGFKLGITTINHGAKTLRIVRNCVAYNNRVRGFDQNNALCAMELYNNTAYKNGTNGFVLNYKDIFCKVKNCISYKNTLMPEISKSSIVERNVFSDDNQKTGESPITDDDFISLNESQLIWQRKADGSLPDIEFLNLKTGSPLIDAGVDVGMPYYGKAPDIGAFEVSVGEVQINKLPVVSISSPTKSTSFTAPATISITIEASDPDGSIIKVELFDGARKLTESTVTPFTFTLKDLPAGTYKLRAVATDNLKATNTSDVMEVIVVAFNEKGEHFNLYPNPNDGRFTVDFSSLVEAKSFMLTVVDLIGNTVFQEQISSDESTRQFDLSHLNSGIYILIIAAGQILLTQKLILN
jgi:predicted Rdx family selenoprotein